MFGSSIYNVCGVRFWLSCENQYGFTAHVLTCIVVITFICNSIACQYYIFSFEIIVITGAWHNKIVGAKFIIVPADL